jgi:paraquat-inducible protein B
MTFLIPVYAKLYNDETLSEDSKDERKRLDILIKDGLRARLAVNSMITGQLLIELDLFPKTEAVLHEVSRNEFEIPTIDSPFAEFSKTLQVIPISKIAQDIHHITNSLQKDLPPLLQHLDSVVKTIDIVLKENQKDAAGMLDNFGKAAINLSKLSRSLNASLGENSNDFSIMIENFSAAAASLKNLTDYLQMHPNALIIGKDY